MDSIADMGGMQGWGPVVVEKDEPVFHDEWERRVHAMGSLAPRISGTNLDAFRHAINRQHPIDYLADGYYGRWLNMAINLLTDSSIIAPGAVEARARKLRGEDVQEPPAPEPRKPDYTPAGPGSIRKMDDAPEFAVGDRVRARDIHPLGHTRLPRYVRGRTGVVRMIQPPHVLPDTNAHFLGENAQHVYNVAFDSTDLWGSECEPFELHLDLYESYLEAAP